MALLGTVKPSASFITRSTGIKLPIFTPSGTLSFKSISARMVLPVPSAGKILDNTAVSS